MKEQQKLQMYLLRHGRKPNITNMFTKTYRGNEDYKIYLPRNAGTTKIQHIN